MWHRHSSLERGVGSPAAKDLKHRRYHPYHHYFDHQTFIKCYGKFISFWKTELISDNTPQPGVCSSSLWDELAAISWSPSRYVDGAKKAIDDSTDKLIMNCVLPLCWSLGGNKQRCENEACYQVDSPLKQTKESYSAVSISGYSSDAVPSLCYDKETDSGALERGWLYYVLGGFQPTPLS